MKDGNDCCCGAPAVMTDPVNDKLIREDKIDCSTEHMLMKK
ncbi:MAG: hypothetical protein ACOX41_03165 [Anaerovoracaceae bacterium]